MHTHTTRPQRSDLFHVGAQIVMQQVRSLGAGKKRETIWGGEGRQTNLLPRPSAFFLPRGHKGPEWWVFRGKDGRKSESRHEWELWRDGGCCWGRRWIQQNQSEDMTEKQGNAGRGSMRSIGEGVKRKHWHQERHGLKSRRRKKATTVTLTYSDIWIFFTFMDRFNGNHTWANFFPHFIIFDLRFWKRVEPWCLIVESKTI